MVLDRSRLLRPLLLAMVSAASERRAVKACRDCGFPKELTEFYIASGMRDGHSNTCKVCCASAAQAARRHGHTLELRRVAFAKTGRCGECENLTWRRKWPHCEVCLEAPEEEDVSGIHEEIVQRRSFVS